MRADDLVTGLPAEMLVRQGLADYNAGHRTASACLVAIARLRLIAAGLLPADRPRLMLEPERELYRLLRRDGGDAYGRYNSLVRELVSFEQALEHRQRRDAEQQTKS